MAWSASKIFRAFLLDVLENTAAFDLGGTPDSFKVALFDNDITPSQTVTAANSAFAAGVWTTSGASGAEEVYEAGQWATGGVALTSPDISNPTTVIVMFDASDTSSGSSADLANVNGCLIYDDTLASPVADQGICFLWMGGSNSVVAGTFTVSYAAPNSGLFAVTV